VFCLCVFDENGYYSGKVTKIKHINDKGGARHYIQLLDLLQNLQEEIHLQIY